MMFVAPRWQMPGGFAPGWAGRPSGANQRRKCYRAAQILWTEAVMCLSKARRGLLKHIIALCINIFEFEIGSGICHL